MGKYTKDRIKTARKHYERKSTKDKCRSQKASVYSAYGQSPSDLTEYEYIEVHKSKFLDFLYEYTNSKSNSVYKFLSFINEDDPSLAKEFNRAKEYIHTFLSEMGLQNQCIENYKKARGIPLNVDESINKLYSIN